MATLIEPKGKGYFVIQFSDGGRRRYHTIGRVDRKEAERQLQEFEARQVLGLPTETADPAKGLTFDDVVAICYMPILDRKSEKTQEVELRGLGHLRRHWPGIKLAQVTLPRIEAFKSARLREKARSRTVNMELSALRNVLSAAEMHGLLPNGAPRIRSLRIKDARPSKYLTLDQARRLEAALVRLARRGGRYYPGVMAALVGLHSGMRRGEILSREVEDIDWSIGEYGALRVSGKPEIGWSPKTGLDRTIPLTELLASELRRFLTWRGDDPGWIFRIGAQGFLFRVADGARRLSIAQPMSVESLAPLLVHLEHLSNRTEPWRYTVAHAIQRHRKMFIHRSHGVWRGRADYEIPEPRRIKSFRNTLRTACKEAGVPDIHPHALRHTWATLAFAAGMDLKAVQELGGWKNPDVPLSIYAHTSTEHAQAAMRKFPLGRMANADVVPFTGKTTERS